MTAIRFVDEVNEWTAARFVGEVNSVPGGSEMSVYISTPGGDIFAGGEMVNAVEHALERGCVVSLELGAIVASMGAALVAAARARGCHVTARSNTQMMFHGCYVRITGGADELTDEAKVLRDFNSNVIANLKRCGVSACEEWFSADRQKWLNAEEVVALGLADEVAGIDVDAKIDGVSVANLFAAKWNGKGVNMIKDVNIAVDKPVDNHQAPENDAGAAATEEVADMIPRAEADARVSGMQAAMQKQINDLRVQMDAKEQELATAKAETTRLTDALNAANMKAQELADQVTSLTDERDAAKNALDTLNGRVNHVNAAPKPTWTDARKHLASLPMAERAAFYAAHRAEIDNRIKE